MTLFEYFLFIDYSRFLVIVVPILFPHINIYYKQLQVHFFVMYTVDMPPNSDKMQTTSRINATNNIETYRPQSLENLIKCRSADERNAPYVEPIIYTHNPEQDNIRTHVMKRLVLSTVIYFVCYTIMGVLGGSVAYMRFPRYPYQSFPSQL